MIHLIGMVYLLTRFNFLLIGACLGCSALWLLSAGQLQAKSRMENARLPSVELNLGVLQHLHQTANILSNITPAIAPVQVQNMPQTSLRKLPSEQPYMPPVRLPADAARQAARAPQQQFIPQQAVPAPVVATSARAVLQPQRSRYARRRLPRRVSQLNRQIVPFAKGESVAHKLSDVSSKNFAKARSAKPALPPVTQAANKPNPVYQAPAITAKKTVKLAKKTVAAKPKLPPVSNFVKPAAPAFKRQTAKASAQAKSPQPLPSPLLLTPKTTSQSQPRHAPPPLPKAPKPAKISPAPPLQHAQVEAAPYPTKAPPKIPAFATPKPAIPHVPPPPSLQGLDFSHLKQPASPNAGELQGVTPDKLLGNQNETLVVARAEPALLPEIQVPQHGGNLPPLAAKQARDAEEKGLVSSLSARISSLFTKEPEAQGVLRDETRVINPLEQQKQKRLAAQKAEENLLPPVLPTPNALDQKSHLPVVILPHEAASAQAKSKPSTSKLLPHQSAQKIDLSAPKVAALPHLPSLDALRNNKVSSGFGGANSHNADIALPKPPSAPGPIVTRGEVATNSDGNKPQNKKLALAEKPSSKLDSKVGAKASSKASSKDAAKASAKAGSKEAPKPTGRNLVKEQGAATLPSPITLAALPPSALNARLPDEGVLAPLPPLPSKPKLAGEKAKPAVSKVSPAPKVSGNQKPETSIYFSRDATELNQKAKSALLKIAEKVKRKKLSVRIIAYAEGSENEASIARRVSLSRALQARAFLIDKGINQLKINVQAKGHHVPDGVPNRADIFVR
jgi:outer membrane protein OmpA-like peptidoglycan-associated protein